MKALPPTLRENRRYILLRVIGDAVPSQKEIYHILSDAVTSLFGDAGAVEMHPAIVWSEGEYAVARCSRGSEQRLIAAAATVTRICGKPAALRTVIVSGTIHGAKKHLRPTPWDETSLPGYRCSGKKVDSLTGSNTHRYLTRDDIHIQE